MVVYLKAGETGETREKPVPDSESSTMNPERGSNPRAAAVEGECSYSSTTERTM